MHPQEREAYEIRQLQDNKKLIDKKVFKEPVKLLTQIEAIHDNQSK